MTVQEALLATVDGIEMGSALTEKALLDAGLMGGDVYDADMRESVDRCAIDLLYALYTHPDVSEGGYSLGHADFFRKIEARLVFLARRYNIEPILSQFEKRPQVRNATNKW